MPVLYLTEPGVTLGLNAGRLRVEKRAEVLLSVPLSRVQGVMAFGAVQITTAALLHLLAQGAPVAWVSRRGRLRGRAVPPLSKNVPLRLRQFARREDDAFRLSLARAMVRGKIVNQRTLLLRGARRNVEREVRHVAREAAHCLGRSVHECERCMSLQALMGVEGAAARAYFRAFEVLLPAGWNFASRTRRPPADPVNALLSLGYNLAGHEISTALEVAGLDPFVGFLHSVRHGRPALALDLLEEFRAPFVDRLTCRLLNLRMVTSADFETTGSRTDQGTTGKETQTDEKGTQSVQLSDAALRCYLAEYERAVAAPLTDARDGKSTSFRRLFTAQARRLARSIRTGEAYEPFRYK